MEIQGTSKELEELKISIIEKAIKEKYFENTKSLGGIESMEKLKMKYERKIGKEKELIFETDNFESTLNWTITALYDGAVKRAKIKTNQYYIGNVEYCEIIATYTRYEEDQEIKDIYTIRNWRNDWGNFINVHKTFENNRIELTERGE
jgi:hypothetical protein